MEDQKDWPDIYSAALDCDGLFDKYLTTIAEPKTSSLLGESAVAFGRLAKDNQARFQAWSSYLGVFAEPNVCLDRRLSNSKDVQVMVINILRIIALNLRHFLCMIQLSDDGNVNVAPMKQTQSQIRRSALDYTNDLATDLGQTQESIDGAVDRLHRLGVTIRQSSTASLISRVKAFSAKRSDSSLEEISFLMIKFLYPTAPLSLQRLLGRSILERYFNIMYREEHQRRLATRRSLVLDDEEEDQPRAHNSDAKPSKTITRGDYFDNRGNASNTTGDELAEQKADPDATHSKSGTRPSTLQIDELQRRIKTERRRTGLSATSMTSSVPIGDISYPKPPKPSGYGESDWVICSWCFESYPHGNFQDTRWWRRHVDRDLQPYVCLANTCSASLDAFGRFSPWIEHMEKHHSSNWIATINCKVQWRCDIEHESPKMFVNEALLRHHMREHHLESFTESQIVGIARRSSIRVPGSRDVCPLCGFDVSKAPHVADQPSYSQHSSQIKRKRHSKPTPRTRLSVSIRTKRRKIHSPGQRERSDCGSTSSDESDLELASGPSTESISPQTKDRLRQKQLSRHIATHLKALSFMSLRLKAFQEQSGKGDQDSNTGDEQEGTSESNEPSGLDTELDALSLSFKDNPASTEASGDFLLDDLNELQEAWSVNQGPDPLDLDASIGNSDNLRERSNINLKIRPWLGMTTVTTEDILRDRGSVISSSAGPSSTGAVLGDTVEVIGGFELDHGPDPWMQSIFELDHLPKSSHFLPYGSSDSIQWPRIVWTANETDPNSELPGPEPG